MEYPGFVGGSYQSQAVTADQERTVNWYVERMESQGATSGSALYPTPGVELIATATNGPGRAHFFEDGREFAVCGGMFYEIGQYGALTERGAVAIDANPATICSNGDGGGELFITSGGNGYLYTLTADSIVSIPALDGKASMGDHLDGYFLALDATTSTLYISNLLDGATWDPTQFAQRSAASDPWISMKVSGRYVWLFGQQTSEVWYNTGSSPFPLAPHPSGLTPYGIAAAFSAAVADGVVIWLGASRSGEGQVLRAAGFAPEVISTFSLQNTLAGYSILSDAEAMAYSDLGHTFYVLSFPGANATWAYDSHSGQWAERGQWVASENRFRQWRPRWHAMAFGEHRVLDSETPSIYRMSSDYHTDTNGIGIRRMRRAPALAAENQRIFYSAFELDMEPGVGLSVGQGSDPQVMLRLSNDGGKTWGAEMMRSAGKIGEYARRVRWNRLGAARRRVFEVSVSDPIPWRLTNAFLTLGQPLPASARAAQATQGSA